MHPSPLPIPSQIGVGLSGIIPGSSQIGAAFSDKGAIGAGFTRTMALCLYPQPTYPCPTPYVDPISPKVTQHDPMLRESAEGRKPFLVASSQELAALLSKTTSRTHSPSRSMLDFTICSPLCQEKSTATNGGKNGH